MLVARCLGNNSQAVALLHEVTIHQWWASLAPGTDRGWHTQTEGPGSRYLETEATGRNTLDEDPCDVFHSIRHTEVLVMLHT